LPTLRRNRKRYCLWMPLIRALWSIFVTKPTLSLTDCTPLFLKMKREAGVDMSYVRRTLMKCRSPLSLTLLFLCYIREISNSEEHSAWCCNTSVYGRVTSWQSQWPHWQRIYSPKTCEFSPTKLQITSSCAIRKHLLILKILSEHYLCFMIRKHLSLMHYRIRLKINQDCFLCPT
jgi:hypothetical protein